MGDDVLIRAEGVSKKFCKSLKRSMLYGLSDMGRNLIGRTTDRSVLRKREFWALKDVSFELKRGECLGIIGPNGAGKSSLLKILNGILMPDLGSVRVRGRVGALIEVGAGFHPMLTGRENIYVNGAILGMPKTEIDKKFDQIVAFSEIEDFLDTPVKLYSSGMYVRLGFAVAAHLNPQLLLVDEVLAVGDVGFRMKCYKHLLDLMDEGTSIIVVSHNVNEISRVAKRVLVLKTGQTIFDGPTHEAIASYIQIFRPVTERRLRQGIETPHIEDVRLENKNGSSRDEFLTGDTLRVNITLRTPRNYSGARLIVALGSPSIGNFGSVSTPHTNFQFEITAPHTTVSLLLPDLPLLIGAYHLNVSLFGPQIDDFFDRWLYAAPFRIVGPPINTLGYGVSDWFNFKHSWELVS